MARGFLTAAFALVGLLMAGRPAQAQNSPRAVPLGPLTSEEAVPVQRLGYVLTVEGLDPIPRGSAQFDLWLGYGNVFQRDSTDTHDLTADFERLITAVTARWGVAEGVEIGGRMTFETTGGGWMDRWIDDFHGLLGLRSDVREEFPRDQYTQELRGSDGGLVAAVPRRDFTLEDVRLFSRWRAWASESGGTAAGLRGELRIPTAQNAAGEEGTEVALTALGRTRLGPVHLHAAFGAATVSGELDPSRQRSVQRFGSLALEVRLWDSVSAVLQGAATTSRLNGFRGQEVDGPHTYVVAGLRGVAGAWGWQVSFQEDLPGAGSSADFTMQAGVSRRW